MSKFENPSDADIKHLLQSVKNIAVVGLSPKPSRPSHDVAKLMQGFGYRIIPVRPATDEVLGEKAFANLNEVDKPIDLVNVFLNPSRVDTIINACIEHKLPAIWLQEGVINEPAALKARQAGITVIMDRCIYKDYIKLLAG